MPKAVLLTKSDDRFAAQVGEVSDDDLRANTPECDVTVAVEYSSVNYKDALALTNTGPVVRRWPMVAGIDAAGAVLDSADAAFKPGDKVEWLLQLPARLSTRQAMAIGTAGYTAMLCCLALRDAGLEPGGGDVLVTGASGGVGSIAIAILAGWGFRVTASTGKSAETDFLRAMGAASVIDRAELAAPGKPLQKERWSGVVDSVGSHTLANACAQTRYGGAVAACGLAQGMDFPATVAPFILRGVRLLGIDSVMCPRARRRLAWERLASDLDRARLENATVEIGLAGAIEVAPELLAGKVRGRVVVDVNA